MGTQVILFQPRRGSSWPPPGWRLVVIGTGAAWFCLHGQRMCISRLLPHKVWRRPTGVSVAVQTASNGSAAQGGWLLCKGPHSRVSAGRVCS